MRNRLASINMIVLEEANKETIIAPPLLLNFSNNKKASQEKKSATQSHDSIENRLAEIHKIVSEIKEK